MGRFHCIGDGCAEVHLREYTPPLVRWRYSEEEPWQEIVGDDYQIEDDSPQFEFTGRRKYQIRAKAIVDGRVPITPPYGHLPTKYADGELIEVFTTGTYTAPIFSVKPNYSAEHNLNFEIVYTSKNGGNVYLDYCEKRTVVVPAFTVKEGVFSGVARYTTPTASTPAINTLIGLFDYELVDMGEANPCINDLPFECTLKIYLKGELIHEEVNNTCPEVEQLPCQLGEVQIIKTDKDNWQEKIHVVSNSESNDLEIYLRELIGGTIPDECIEVWKTPVLDLPDFDSTIFDFTTNTFGEEQYEYLGQYCSSVGCPPPKYEVICNDYCQGCPADTCEVDCGDHLCCYDGDGVAVESIPK